MSRGRPSFARAGAVVRGGVGVVARFGAVAFAAASVAALDNGLGRTPVQGWNSWNCYGSGVTAADLQATVDFFTTSGLRDAGYVYVSTDDGWMDGRDAQGKIRANPATFPQGIEGVAAYAHTRGAKLGVYSAASSVVCSGRVGSLYHEASDAQTFADWGVDLVKYDNCGERLERDVPAAALPLPAHSPPAARLASPRR